MLFDSIAALTKMLKVQKTSLSSDIHTLQFVTHISHCTFPSCDWWPRQCDAKCLVMVRIVILELHFLISVWDNSSKVINYLSEKLHY